MSHELLQCGPYLVQLVAILDHRQLRVVPHRQHHTVAQRRLLERVMEPSRKRKQLLRKQRFRNSGE